MTREPDHYQEWRDYHDRRDGIRPGWKRTRREALVSSLVLLFYAALTLVALAFIALGFYNAVGAWT